MLKDNEVAIGRFASAFGIKGEVKIVSLTEFPERFDEGNRIKVRYSASEYAEYTIEHSRPVGPNFTVKLKEIDDRTGAEKLKDLYVFVFEDELMPLEDGREYIFNIVGMKAVTEDGEEIGEVTNVLTGGANDVYEINHSLLIPAIPSVVLKKDREKRVMTVFKMPGLF